MTYVNRIEDVYQEHWFVENASSLFHGIYDESMFIKLANTSEKIACIEASETTEAIMTKRANLMASAPDMNRALIKIHNICMNPDSDARMIGEIASIAKEWSKS